MKKKKPLISRVNFALEELESRQMLSADGITIYAAGATGEESMALLVDGQVVRTWQNIGGNYQNRIFQALTHEISGITVDRVRIAFTNDGLTSTGADRNLRIDKINLYNTDYQAEDSTVLSTGTWNSADGCAPGYKRSEELHCGGYVDFSGSVSGARINIRAAGSTGTEQLRLIIDGQIVQTWNEIGGDYDNGVYQTFTYAHPTALTADRVRVGFFEDLTTLEDQNLRVDAMELEGLIYESEAVDVLSTGTWTASNGCGAGFKQSEFLHCNGYFQYGATGTTVTVLAAGETGEEQVELLINGVPVATWDNVAGDAANGVFESLTYQSPDAVTADDIRVAFTNDGTSSSGGDRNVRVRGIELNSVFHAADLPYVFSVGSWTASDGCGAGFKQSEYLHCGGYFQFASGPPIDPGAIGLATNTYFANETDPRVEVQILRSGGTDGIATVDYRTVDDSALAGTDYVAVSGRAVFQPGESSRTIAIPLLDDSLGEGTEQLSFTIDNVNGGATLLAPRTARISILDDELPPGPGDGFVVEYPDFSSPINLALNGSASLVGSQLRLTPAQLNQAGSAYFTSAMEILPDTSFATYFRFVIDGGQGLAGGDGLAFVLQNAVNGPNALGDSGDSKGYAGISGLSMAVEFDTYRDSHDPNDNQVAVLLNGDVVTPLISARAPKNLNSGNTRHVWIEYDGPTEQLDVFIASNSTQPTAPLLTQSIDLADVLNGRAYFGLSGGTGSVANEHRLLGWSMASSHRLIPPPPAFVGEVVYEGFHLPTAMDFSPDGRNLYVAEKGGRVRVVRDGQILANPVVDISDRVNGTRDRGLLDIAVHPDLANHPYLYLLYTYDPPEVNNYTGLAGPDGEGNRAGRLTRVTLDAATSYTTASAASEEVVLGRNSTWANFNGFVDSTFDLSEPPAGILPDGSNLRDFLAADSVSHSVGSVEFGPDGMLYVTNGDGTSYNQVDPRTVRVQDIDNLSGKLLRIDPLTGNGLPDNPYFDGDAESNQSKVYQYGLRNAFRFAFEESTGDIYLGDVGWTEYEEINVAAPGANFGWPFYEGGTGVNRQTLGYRGLPEAQAFYASNPDAEPALLALDHQLDGINAIVLGDFMTAAVYGAEFQGDLLFNDLGQGIVRNVSFNADGEITAVDTFATGANVLVHMKMGPDDYVYYVELNRGRIGRWVPDVAGSSTSTTVASGESEYLRTSWRGMAGSQVAPTRVNRDREPFPLFHESINVPAGSAFVLQWPRSDDDDEFILQRSRATDSAGLRLPILPIGAHDVRADEFRIAEPKLGTEPFKPTPWADLRKRS